MTLPNQPKILSVGTAVPQYAIGQSKAKEFARAMFGEAHRDIERLMPLFDNVDVRERRFCVPFEWFEGDHTFPEKNDLYIENALRLSEEAARRAMERASIEAEDVGSIIFVSTTGFSTPSLDSKLLFSLGLSTHTRRLPVWGLGCAGGAAGLARAAELASVHPDENVLLIAVELSGLTFQRGDTSKANLISTSLFSDGAAAVVVGCDGEGVEVTGAGSTTWPETGNVMGWELVESGLKVELSRDVPKIVYEKFRPDLEAACNANGLELADIEHFVMHPGGAKVLAAFEDVLDLDRGSLVHSRGVLRDHGNMSAPTVLFILERFLSCGDFSPGKPGVLSAMGPGFSAEHVFLRG